MVSTTVLGWGGLVLALCVTTFGIWWCVTLTVCLLVFIIGGLTLLYLVHWEATLKYTTDLYRRRSHDIRPGLSRVVSASQAAERDPPRLDKRITGAQAVDETLQEVLALVLRDYLHPWYNRLSADEEFPREVRRTAQRLAVNFASRVKEVDWIPYLTTRLVDDAASHLRLFRQARAKAKQLQAQQYRTTSSEPTSLMSVSSLPSAGGDAASKSGGASPVPTSQHQHNHRRTGSSVSLGAHTPPQVAGSGSGSHSPQQQQQQQQQQQLPTQPELEPLFFDLEVTMEGGDLCRDLVCSDPEYEKQFLRDISEVVLFLLLPPEDFQCKALRFLLRELLVSSVLLPLLALFSDPDYINQIIIWLVCKEIPLTSEAFLTALRVTDNRDELTATREIVVREIAQLRSRDSGGEDDTWVKQQLSSLHYLRKVIDARLQRLKDGTDTDSAGLPSQLDWARLVPAGGTGGMRLFSLPLDVVLKNNVALSYFIDYMTSIGAQAYLYFYLNVEGWRVSAEQQISDLELQKMGASVNIVGATPPLAITTATRRQGQGEAALPVPQPDSMREAAYSIFEQYLSEKASPRVRLDETIVRKLLFRIRTEMPHETWFDEAQAAVYEKLQMEECFLPGFRASVGYVRLLAELDLLREPGPGSTGSMGSGTGGHGHGDEEEDSAESSLSDNASLASFESDSSTVPPPAVAAAALLSNPPLLHDTGSTLSLPGAVTVTSGSDCGSVASSVSSAASAAGSQFLAEKRQGPSSLTAEIIETGIVNDRGKTYGIYAVSVSRRYENTGHVDKWHVYRRYSDFHELHSKIKDKYGDLGKLTFPGKKTFHNMERAVLEKRMKMLNDYLQIVMQPGVVGSHPQLRELLAAFLEQGDYGSSGGGSGGSSLGVAQVSHALDSLVVNPLKNSMRSVGQAVRTVPDNLLSTVDGVVDGLSRVFGSGSTSNSLSGSSHGSGSTASLQAGAGTPMLCEATKVGASIDTETADNIPLRIMLLLMDEVFDLKQRNQWLRRRIVTLLRQIIRTMFGDIVNRRILDYVLLMTSPDQVADYLRAFKQALWPNGARAEVRPPRDEATRSRTRVAAKVALLSSLSDELKHIIGSETARRGLLRVFELFQRPVLNRRLLYVLLEGVLHTLFPDNNLEQVFRRLHSRSPRVPRQSSSSGGQQKGASKGSGGSGAPPELGLRGEAIAARTR